MYDKGSKKRRMNSIIADRITKTGRVIQLVSPYGCECGCSACLSASD